MSNNKTASDPITAMREMLNTLEAAVEFVQGMAEDYQDGEIEYAFEDAVNFKDYHIKNLEIEQRRLVKSFNGKRASKKETTTSKRELRKISQEIREVKAQLNSSNTRFGGSEMMMEVEKEMERLDLENLEAFDTEEPYRAFEYDDGRIDMDFSKGHIMVFVEDEESPLSELDRVKFNSVRDLVKAVKGSIRRSETGSIF
jgi:hypothetical protein